MPGWIHSTITIDAAVREHVYLIGVELHGITVKEKDEAILQELQREEAELRRQYHSPAEARERFEPARWLYRSLGVDPTRTRPSSEALMRRILQGKGLYQVNSVVDGFNLLSIRLALPVGLYDTDHVVPPVILRKGAAGESYPGIGKASINLEGRLCLADQEGPFGNPSADSARTRIRMDTQNVLAVFFVPVIVELDHARQRLHACTEFVERFIQPVSSTPFLLHP